jgi:hypothetical protein
MGFLPTVRAFVALAAALPLSLAAVNSVDLTIADKVIAPDGFERRCVDDSYQLAIGSRGADADGQ